MQISLFRGSRTVTSLRLCSRAPWTTSTSEAITDQCIQGDRIEQVFAEGRQHRSGSRDRGRSLGRLAVRKVVARRVPRPVRGAIAQPCPDGVEQHVLAGLLEIVLPFDGARAEAAPEEMAPAFVAPVEGLRVDAV